MVNFGSSRRGKGGGGGNKLRGWGGMRGVEVSR